MGDVPQLALQHRRVLVLDAAADLAEAERTDGAVVGLALADHAAHLGDLQRRHAVTSSTASPVSSPPGASAAATTATATGASGSLASSASSATGAAENGSTSMTVLPRWRATSSGRRRFFRPSTVAFAMLIGFVVPRLFAS